MFRHCLHTQFKQINISVKYSSGKKVVQIYIICIYKYMLYIYIYIYIYIVPYFIQYT